jgi:hypothetical protein
MVVCPFVRLRLASVYPFSIFKHLILISILDLLHISGADPGGGGAP